MAGGSEPNQKLIAARRRLGITQAELADRLLSRLGEDARLDANYLSKLERGRHTWPKPPYRKALREEFGVGTDAELGFYCSRSVPEEDSADVDRRTFFSLTPAVATLSISGPVADFLAQAEPAARAPRSVGRADVDLIAQSTQTFTSWDHRVGGELSVQAVAGQLRWAAGLLEAKNIQPQVRDDLHSAVGHLAQVAAWMSVDVGAHDSAERYFRFGLHCAEQARNTSLRAVVLADMSRQIFHLGRPQDALSLAELAQVRADQLPAPERAMLGVVRARALAQLGRGADTRAAITRAEDDFGRRDSTPVPPWMEFFDGAELAGDAGHALFDLTAAGANPQPALDQLGYASSQHTDDYARSRAFCQLKIATLWMRTDPSVAVAHARTAVTAAESLRSGRIRSYLRELHGATTPHTKNSDVAELRRGISRLTQLSA